MFIQSADYTQYQIVNKIDDIKILIQRIQLAPQNIEKREK